MDHLATLEDGEMKKAGLPVGTIRDRKGGMKFVKVAPGKWRPKYDGQTRGAAQAVAAIKRKIAEAKDAREMLNIVMENRDRFSDKNGNPLPFVQELSAYVREKGDGMEVRDAKAAQEAKAQRRAERVRQKAEKEKQAREVAEILAERGGESGNGPTDERARLKKKFEDMAEPMEVVLFNRENYDRLFPGGKAETPLGEMKLGENQYEKIKAMNRQRLLGAMKQVLSDPLVVYESEGAKVYAKPLTDKGKPKTVVSVVVDRDGINVSISTHQKDLENVLRKIEKGGVLYEKDAAQNGGRAHAPKERDNGPAEPTPNAGSHGGSLETGNRDRHSPTSSPESGEKSSGLAALRQKYRSGKSVEGDEDEIAVGKEIVSGRWRLVESDAPSASHDETTFRKTEGFPANEDGSTINDRDYEKDKAAQEAVLEIASDYDMQALSFDSPVVVTSDGVVISGNNRTMSSKIAARKGTDKKYVEALRKKAKKFGFDAEQVGEFRHPRVVFETAENEGYSTRQFARFNESNKKAMNPIEAAVKVSKTIGARTVESVAEKMSEHDTLGELYADRKAVSDIFNVLQRDGVIGQFDRPQYATEDGITGAGKEFLETALIGSVINEANIRGLNREGCKSIRQKLVRAITPLIENRGMDGYSIAGELNRAVDIAIQVATRKEFASVEEYSKQMNMFSLDDKVSIELAKRLEGTQKEFAEFMQTVNGGLKHAANGEADIFIGEVETKDAILERLLSAGAVKKAVSGAFAFFRRLAKALFDESKHPRDEGGRFSAQDKEAAAALEGRSKGGYPIALADMKTLSGVLESGKSAVIRSTELGDVHIDQGEAKQRSFGIKHIIRQRHLNDGKTADEITSLLVLLADTVRDGVISREVKATDSAGRDIGRYDLQKNGIVAVISKTRDDKNERFVITGFDAVDKEEATDAIKTGIARYGYAPEFSYFRKQVGAVIASLPTVSPGAIRKSTAQGGKTMTRLVIHRTKSGGSRLLLMKSRGAWSDAEHPRDEGGRFSGNGGVRDSGKMADLNGMASSGGYSASLTVSSEGATRAKAIEALDALAGKELVNDETGIKAVISSGQRNKIVSNAAQEKSESNGFDRKKHFAVAGIMDKAWKNASLAETHEDRKQGGNIASIKRFETPIMLDGELAVAYITAKESVEHGHRIYSLELQDIKKPAGKGGRPITRTTPAGLETVGKSGNAQQGRAVTTASCDDENKITSSLLLSQKPVAKSTAQGGKTMTRLVIQRTKSGGSRLLLMKSKTASEKKDSGPKTGDLERLRGLILVHLEAQEDGEMKKAGLPVGTIRDRKGGMKFVKVAPGKWRPKYDGQTRGAAQAVAAIKKKIAEAKDAREMLNIVMENRDRFSDKNGNPLPFVQELSACVNEKGDALEAESAATAKAKKSEAAKKKKGEGQGKAERVRRAIERGIKEWKAGNDTAWEAFAVMRAFGATDDEAREAFGLKPQGPGSFADAMMDEIGVDVNKKVGPAQPKSKPEAFAEKRAGLTPKEKEGTLKGSGPGAYSKKRKEGALWAKEAKEADGALRGACGEAWRNAAKEERKALFDYTINSGECNRPLRGYDKDWANFKGAPPVDPDNEGKGEAIGLMTGLIEKSSYDFDVWLQRGVDETASAALFLGVSEKELESWTQIDMSKALKGKMVTDQGFASCGSAKGAGFSKAPYIFNVYCPRGTRMMYAEPFSNYGKGGKLDWDGAAGQSDFGSECETIIQRGTTFKITKAEMKAGKCYFDVEVVAQIKGATK